MFALTAITANRLEVDLQTRRRGSPSGRAPPPPFPPPPPSTAKTPHQQRSPSRATPHWPRRSPAQDVCVQTSRALQSLKWIPPLLHYHSSRFFGCAADGFAEKQFQTSLGVVLLSYSAARRSLKAVNYFCLACFRPLILKRFPPAPPK